MPYEGDYTQEDYAQQMIDEYRAARVNPWKVFAQSFNLEDVLYWIKNEPHFGRQAVFLTVATAILISITQTPGRGRQT